MTETGKQQYFYAGAVLFLAALVFIYPNRAFLFAPDWIIFCFNTVNITLFALGLTLFKPYGELKGMPVWFRGALLLFLALTVLHCITKQYGAEVLFSLSYLVLPVFGFLYRKELKKAMPPVMTLLWGLTLLQSLAEHFLFDKQALGGLAMNKNWNVSLLLGCLPFVLLFCKGRKSRLAVFALLSIGAVYTVFVTRSMALPVILAGAFFVFLLIRKKYRTAAAVLIAGLAALCLLLRTETAQRFLALEDRPFFYRQTLSLIAESPVYGHGLPSFEQAFLPHRTAEYFYLPHAADRVDHPHNHLLYMAAGLGLAGLAAWLALWLVPAVFTVLRLQKEFEPDRAAFFAAWLVFAVHGQLDLVMEREPMNIIALLLTGMLWQDIKSTEPQTAAVPKILKFAAWGLIAAGLFSAGANLYSSCHFRTAERMLVRKNPANRYHYENAVRFAGLTGNGAYYLYQTAWRHCTASEQEQKTALRLLEWFRSSAVPDFAHVNYMRGRLLLPRDPEAGSAALLREAELFPLDPLPLLALWEYYIAIRNRNAAEAAAEELNRRFAALKLDAEISREQMFPASWRHAEISGADGQALLKDRTFDFYQNIRKYEL